MTSTLTTAPFLKRLAALFYDSLLVIALLMLATALAFWLKGGPVPAHSLFFRLYLLFVGGLFFVGFWVTGGQTLGMQTWRLRVQRSDGRPLGFWQALWRFVLAVPLVGCFGIGLLWMFIDREHLALHDRLSGSRVVMLPKPNSTPQADI
jgi:uncharacterized RDD family membrane protein YckC